MIPTVLEEIGALPKATVNLSDALEEYLSHLSGLGRTDEYQRSLRVALTPYTERPETAQEILNLTATRCSDSTVSKYLTMLRAFAAWLSDRGIESPFGTLKRPSRRTGPVRKPGVLSEASLETLVKCEQVELSNRLLYAFCAQTGLRRKEAAQVRRTHFREDPEIGPVLVIPAANAKSRIEQTVPLSRAAWTYFRERVPFTLPTRPAEQLRRDLRTAGLATEDAMGNTIRFHSLRHYFVTQVTQVADLGSAQALARHSNATTTNRYVHGNRATLRQSIEDAFSSSPLPTE